MSFETPGDNVRCDHCNAYGVPYEYKGLIFSGLCACEGDYLCPKCRDAYLDLKLAEAREVVGVTPIAPEYRYRDWLEIKQRIKEMKRS